MQLYTQDVTLKGPQHEVIVGMTNSGKTWLAMFQSFFACPAGWTKYSRTQGIHWRHVFFDTNNCSADEEYLKQIRWWSNVYAQGQVAIVHNCEDFEQYWDNGTRWIIFAPHLTEGIESYKAKVYETVRLLRSYQASLKSRERWPVWLYFDEVSRLTSRVKESPISEVFTRGRIVQMWGIAISQRPQMVPRYCYDESGYVVFFKLRDEHWSALRGTTYQIKAPMEIIEELHRVKWLYYKYDGHNWIRGRVKS